MEKRIEFNPEKDAANREKHGVSLAFGERVLGDPARLDVRFEYPEERYVCYGRVEGSVWVAVYTRRGRKNRFISVSKPMTGKPRNTRRVREPDPDEPLTDEEFERGYGAMLARKARAKTGLTQQAFADRYGIPVASVRDWEQGRRAPDAAARNYLLVIAKMPAEVARALGESRRRVA